jgi:hypothetical protein
MISKFLSKLGHSFLKWVEERYVKIPDGYGDTEIPIEHFDNELLQVDHGHANKLSRSVHIRKSRPVEC